VCFPPSLFYSNPFPKSGSFPGVDVFAAVAPTAAIESIADFTVTHWLAVFGAIGSLIILEGLLSADNALVLAILVRHLPKHQRTKALRYGIIGAFGFRFIAVALAAYLVKYWFVVLIGGCYLLYLMGHHFLRRGHDEEGTETDIEVEEAQTYARKNQARGFWGTVVAVELADIAFSVDSILAALGVAAGLPRYIQNVEFGPFQLWFWVVFLGGVLGIVTMRLVAGYFILLLERFSTLAEAAYLLVGWIGLKLVGVSLRMMFHPPRNPRTGVVSEPAAWTQSVPQILRDFPWEMNPAVFWSGMSSIVIGALVLGIVRNRRLARLEAAKKVLQEIETEATPIPEPIGVAGAALPRSDTPDKLG